MTIANGGERIVSGGERIVNGGERIVGAGERIVNGGEMIVSRGERNVNGGDRIVNRGERIVRGGEMMVGAGERIVVGRGKPNDRHRGHLAYLGPPPTRSISRQLQSMKPKKLSVGTKHTSLGSVVRGKVDASHVGGTQKSSCSRWQKTHRSRFGVLVAVATLS